MINKNKLGSILIQEILKQYILNLKIMKNTISYLFAISILFVITACERPQPGDIPSSPILPIACFTSKAIHEVCTADCEIQFSNCSKNADAYYWFLGDGQETDNPSPTHKYEHPGKYTVKLKVFRGSGDGLTVDTFVKTIHVGCKDQNPISCFSFDILGK